MNLPDAPLDSLWANDVDGGTIKARAAAVLGGRVSRGGGGSNMSSARLSARSMLIDTPTTMMHNSPRLMELLCRMPSASDMEECLTNRSGLA